MVTKKTLTKMSINQKVKDASEKYKKALNSINSMRATLQTYIVNITHNVINEIDKDVQTGSRIIEKLISNITNIKKLEELKPNVSLGANLPLKLKMLCHLLLGELTEKLLHDQTVLNTLVGDVEALMATRFIKEFSRNNRNDLQQLFNLINIRIQVLKALEEANIDNMT